MGLKHDILNQPVSELELRELIAVRPTTTVREALEQMKQKKLGCVVVVDDEGKPLGKFTERLLIKMLLEHPDALDQQVGDHMANDWDAVQQTDPIATVIDKMESKKLRFVVVLDAQGKAVALTGQKGVMEYIVDHFPRQVKVQRMSTEFFTGQREGG